MMHHTKENTSGKRPETDWDSIELIPDEADKPQEPLLFLALSSELRSFAAAAIRDARMIVSPDPDESRQFDELIAALSGPGLHRDQVLRLMPPENDFINWANGVLLRAVDPLTGKTIREEPVFSKYTGECFAAQWRLNATTRTANIYLGKTLVFGSDKAPCHAMYVAEATG